MGLITSRDRQAHQLVRGRVRLDQKLGLIIELEVMSARLELRILKREY